MIRKFIEKHLVNSAKKTMLDVIKTTNDIEFLRTEFTKTLKEKWELEQERDKYKSIVEKAIKYIEETPIGRILPVHYWEEKDYTKPLLKILKELEEGNSNE